MEEENVIAIREEQMDVQVTDDSANASASESEVQVVNIAIQEPMNIGMDESFIPLGVVDENMNHGQLNGRDLPEQHPISAITGLSAELAAIKALKTVRSDGENIAHYYMWSQALANNDNGYGYFVSLNHNNTITKSGSNVIGVTISPSDAAFIGNEVVGGRNASYGLVCISGIVRVRVSDNTIVAGNKVIPSVGGYAAKSTNNYGYNVIAIENSSGCRYAVIALVPQTTDIFSLSDDIADVEDRLDIDEANITSAINTANSAVQNVNSTASQVSGQITTIQGQVQSAVSTANAASVAATSASVSAALAKSIAETAQTAAESIQSQVATDISDMEDDIQDLIDSVEPIVTWDGTNGTAGASYLIDHIQNDLATKTEVSTVDTRVDNAFTAIQTNAKTMQTMAMIERKYSVGPHSPVYGMSYTYATEMVPVGMVYVPTVDVVDTTDDGNHSFTFYSGNSYEWNGTSWIEHTDNVALSSTYTTGNAQIKYWYVGASDVTNNNIIYTAGSLCLWNNDMWVVVANTKDYGNFHITSRLYQTADELGAEIANAQGDITTINTRITNDESQINALAVQQSTQGGTIASLQANATETNARIDSIVMYNGNVLMQTLVLDSTPSGSQFYTTEPTWGETKWSFSNTYVDVPVSPCWAKVTGDDTQYYKYTVSAGNVWTRETYKYINSLSGIQQKVSANESKLSLVVSQENGNNVINAASIVAAVNADDSNISMSADRIKLTGGEISLATGHFRITANNGFEINENGITWTSASNPTKMVYSQVLVAKPVNNTQYSSFPDSSTSSWHKNITTSDKYASETTDGGTTWSAVRKFVGEDGSGVSILGTAYAQTSIDDQDIGSTFEIYSDSGLVNKITVNSLGDAYLVDGYLFVYSNNNDDFICTGKIQGPSGQDGADAIVVTPTPSTLYFRCNSDGTFRDRTTKSLTFNVTSGNAYTIKTFTTATGYTIAISGTSLNVTPSGTAPHESDNIQVVVTSDGVDYYTIVTLAKIYDGKDAVTLNVYSTNGDTFKVGDISTYLYAVVRRGTTNITLQIPYTNFVWTKIDNQGNVVNNWTPIYTYEGRHDTITLTNADVYERATFECKIDE